jgi:hypothetical protein
MPRITRPWRSQAPVSNAESGEPSDPHSTAGQSAGDMSLPPQAQPQPPTPDPIFAAPNPTAPQQSPPDAHAEEPPPPVNTTPIAGLELPADGQSAGFSERGRIRRRIHFLLKARELAYRDLGGLVFDLHRFGQRHDTLVAAKLSTLDSIDIELRTLQVALGERRSLTVLREAGVAACPRCAAIHGSDDRFCPACGMPMGRRADRPIAVASGSPPTTPTPAPQPTPPATQMPGQTSLALPGSAAIPVPAPPPTGSWTAELARPGADPQRAATPGEREAPTQIIHPDQAPGDLVSGATRARPDETPPAR